MAKTKLRLVDSAGPPRPLGEHGTALWRSIVSEYDITDSAGRELLCLACQALDRAEQIADLIAYAGAGTVSEAGVPRSNPMVKDEQAWRAQVAKRLNELGLNQEPAKANGRPTGSWNYEKAKGAAS